MFELDFPRELRLLMLRMWCKRCSMQCLRSTTVLEKLLNLLRILPAQKKKNVCIVFFVSTHAKVE